LPCFFAKCNFYGNNYIIIKPVIPVFSGIPRWDTQDDNPPTFDIIFTGLSELARGSPPHKNIFNPLTPKTMTTEFTTWCSQYYHLTKLFAARDERFKNLLDNAPLYTNQRNLSDLDAIISYNRKVQAAKAKADKTFKELTETGRTILMIMQYFEIPARTVLTGEIPGEMEYEVWANDKDQVFIGKIRDLPKEPEDPNIIRIKIANWNKTDDEDDD
jgi:hypothetical protein